MKRILIVLLALLTSSTAWAQAAETPSFWRDPFSHPLMPFYGLMAMIVLVIFLIALVGISMIRVLNTLSDNLAKERAAREGLVYRPRPSAWKRFLQSMNASVPVTEEKNIELDHDYDGIRELDNHLPPWWKYLFYATIVWSVVYLIAYHVTDSLPLQEGEYENQVAEAEVVKKKHQASQPKEVIDESTLAYSHDEAIIAKGRNLYTANCAACHKADGGGSIGPNLTDEYWLHGGDVKNVYAVVKNGVPEKGMIPWGGVLSPEQLRDVSFFVMSLQGSNPPGAKSPQGNVHKATAPVVAKDTTGIQASL